MDAMNQRLLLAQIAVIEMLTSAGLRLRDTVRRTARDVRGQTPTEYLMIVGLMAVVVVVVFVAFYWTRVRTAAQTWVNNVQQSVTGKSITPR